MPKTKPNPRKASARTSPERRRDIAGMRNSLRLMRAMAFVDRKQRRDIVELLAEAMTSPDRPVIDAVRSICAASLRRHVALMRSGS